MQIWEKYLLPLPNRVAAAPLSSLSLSSKDMHLCYMRLGPSNLLLERSLVFWKMMITCVLWLACSSSLLDLFPSCSKKIGHGLVVFLVFLRCYGWYGGVCLAADMIVLMWEVWCGWLFLLIVGNAMESKFEFYVWQACPYIGLAWGLLGVEVIVDILLVDRHA